MSNLADEKIVLSKKGDPAMDPADVQAMLDKVPGWKIIQDDGSEKLEREFEFRDYLMLIDLCHKIGCIAEQENHHPEMHIQWGKLTVTWWTHVTGGLQRNDFIMAARCNRAAMLISAP